MLSITVDTLVDENDGVGVGGISLRDAIEASTPGETIDFAVSGTISLEHGILSVEHDLAIDGPGSDLLTIQADESNGIFRITDSSAALLDVTIDDLTLTGGDAVSGGGAIDSNEDLTVTSVVFSLNTAGFGGAINTNSGGSLMIVDSVFHSNSATGSGGAVNYNNTGSTPVAVQITNSVFTDNIADDFVGINGNATGLGGAVSISINNPNALIDVSESVFTGNRAADGGALGIKGVASSVTVADSCFGSSADADLGNTATRFGGGIMISVDRADIEITGSVIAGNTSLYDGGGVFVIGGAGTFSDSTFQYEIAYPSRPGDVLLQDLTVRDNRAIRSGAALDYDRPAGNGGGIFAIIGQDEDVDNDSELIVRRNSIHGNSATGNGGGVYMEVRANADPQLVDQVVGAHLVDSTIFENTAYGDTTQWITTDPHDGGGGGVYFHVAENLLGELAPTGTVTNVTVSNNRALFGGGLHLGSPVEVKHSTVAFNTAGPFVGDPEAPEKSAIEQVTMGGGVYLSYADAQPERLPRFSHSIIASNVHLLDDAEIGSGDPIIGQSGRDHPNDNYSPDIGARVSGTIDVYPNAYHDQLPLSSPFGTFVFEYTMVGDITGPLSPTQNFIDATGAGYMPNVGSATGFLDANLAPNGGPGLPGAEYLLTHALLPGGAAVDAGDPNAVAGAGDVPEFDQRNDPFTRVYDGDSDTIDVIDIGAFESQPIPPDEALYGDYNDDGIVDILDYSVWRDRLGDVFQLPNEDPSVTPGEVTAGDYDVWVMNFGETDDAFDGFCTCQLEPVSLPLVVFGAPPTITDVVISGSSSLHDPYSFADAGVVGSGDQLRTVPVGGADTISLVFSEDVNVSQGDLDIVGLLTAYEPQIEDFEYDVATKTASWRLTGLGGIGDHFAITLKDTVTDIEGTPLDGEWVNPIDVDSTDPLVSTFATMGNGTSGGDFVFVVTLLAGDLDRDNVVTFGDFGVFSSNYDVLLEGAQFEDGDLNGDGAVDFSDFGSFNVNYERDLTGALAILADSDGDNDVDDDDVVSDLDGDGDIDGDDEDLFWAQYGLDLEIA